MENRFTFNKIINALRVNPQDFTKKSFTTNQFLINIVVAFSLGLIISILLAILFFKFHQLYYPLENLDIIYSEFLENLVGSIQPKPHERFAFIMLLLLLPLLSYSLVKLTLSISHRDKYYFQLCTKFIICILSILIIYVMYSSEYLMHILYTTHFYQTKWVVYLLFGISIYISYYLQTPHVLNPKFRKYISLLTLLIVVSSILLQSISFRIQSLHHVDASGNWISHFGAAFYSVTQVFAGKTILVHLPAQYGMYSEILNPIFKIIGLSVFKFTLVMAILQITALMALFTFQWKLMRSKLLIGVSMLTLCLETGYTWCFISSEYMEAYYQYYPIRFFFPSLFVLGMLYFIRYKNLMMLLSLTLLSSLAIIWNVESGVAIYGSLLAYIGSFIVFPSKDFHIKNAITFTMYSIITFSLSIILFLLYLFIKSGYIPDLSLIFKYQTIFYKAGFAMIPIPTTLNPWQIIFAIYLLGLIGAVLNWVNKKRPLYWEAIFCLSIMGLGLFVYFQGRSHPIVLILVSWPAILISFILIDLIFRLVRLNLTPKVAMVFCFPILLFGLFATTKFILGVPMLLKSGLYNGKLMQANAETEITRNLAFIKSHLNGEKEVAILAPNQAVYYGETGVGSSVKGPGLIEVLLKSDLESLKEQLINNKQIIFYQSRDDMFGTHDLGNALDSYRVVAKSQDGMSYLVKK